MAFFNGRSLWKPRVVRRGASIKIHFRPNGAIVPKLIFLGCKPKPVFKLPPMLTPNVPIIITRKTEFFIFRPWPMPQGRKIINFGFQECIDWCGQFFNQLRLAEIIKKHADQRKTHVYQLVRGLTWHIYVHGVTASTTSQSPLSHLTVTPQSPLQSPHSHLCEKPIENKAGQPFPKVPLFELRYSYRDGA